MGSQLPLLSAERGCASELTQSCFILGFHGQLRELHENWEAFCLFFFFLRWIFTPFALCLSLVPAALIHAGVSAELYVMLVQMHTILT